VKLTEEEVNGLSARARAYIEYLEQEVSGLNGGAGGSEVQMLLRAPIPRQ
jgi:hypothetical protein